MSTEKFCTYCGTTGGNGTLLRITQGANGEHYEPVPCPACAPNQQVKSGGDPS